MFAGFFLVSGWFVKNLNILAKRKKPSTDAPALSKLFLDEEADTETGDTSATDQYPKDATLVPVKASKGTA